jgi:hypothetical protein
MSQATQESSDVERAEPLNRTISLKVTASEDSALVLVAAARNISAPATLLRTMSLVEIVETAERVRGAIAEGVAA